MNALLAAATILVQITLIVTGWRYSMKQASRVRLYSREQLDARCGPAAMHPHSMFSWRVLLAWLSTFLSVSPHPQPLRHLLSALAAFMGFLYASTALVGEYYYVRGYGEEPEKALVTLSAAARIFPWQLQVRRGAADYVAQVHLPNPHYRSEAIWLLHKALALDPNASDLRIALARYYADAGRVDDANAELVQVQKLNPTAHLVWKWSQK